MPRDLSYALFVALVVVGLIGGFVAVGGPGQGAAERRDDRRVTDLDQLGGYVDCLARLNNDTLPATMPYHADCVGGRRLADPRTGAPYRYKKIAATTFHVCAEFEAPRRSRMTPERNPNLDVASGCMTHRYWP